MNDWWSYLEHGWFGKNGQKGSEKKNHKYYARVPTGTKDGHNVYRYFYSKEDYAAYIRSGKKKLTGEYGMEKHTNGRIAWTATEQYTDKDGKLQTRKKYVSAETASKLRDDKYRKEEAPERNSEGKEGADEGSKEALQQEDGRDETETRRAEGLPDCEQTFGKADGLQEKAEQQNREQGLPESRMAQEHVCSGSLCAESKVR